MLCKKSALKLVKRGIDNNGLETWRQLQLCHGNKDSFGQLGTLQQIIKFSFGSNIDQTEDLIHSLDIKVTT
eukprot:2196097-Heterocapsa_arctica.AAC.1